jgi:hypothetical protein
MISPAGVKKTSPVIGSQGMKTGLGNLQDHHSSSLRAFCALFHAELDALSFFQFAEAIALDS